MKHFLSLIFLLPLTCFAKWTPSSGSEDSTTYIDFETIVYTDHAVKVWTLLDINSPQKLPSGSFYSIKSFMEYNCIDKTSKQLSSVFYAKKMGTGKVIFSNLNRYKSADWQPIVPEGSDDFTFNLLCVRIPYDLIARSGSFEK